MKASNVSLPAIATNLQFFAVFLTDGSGTRSEILDLVDFRIRAPEAAADGSELDARAGTPPELLTGCVGACVIGLSLGNVKNLKSARGGLRTLDLRMSQERDAGSVSEDMSAPASYPMSAALCPAKPPGLTFR